MRLFLEPTAKGTLCSQKPLKNVLSSWLSSARIEVTESFIEPAMGGRMLKQFIVALCFLVTSCTSTEAPNNLQANEQATNASDTTAQSNAGDDSGADQSAIGYAPDGSLSAEEQRQANQELHAPTNAE